MKTKIRMFMTGGAIVCALFAGSAMAATHRDKTDGKSLQVQVNQLNNSEKIRIIVDNPDGNRIIVTLRDLSGSFISRIVGSKADKEVIHDYDFNSAEDGTYYLDIYDGHNTVKKEIHLVRVHQPDITQMSVR